MFIPHLYLDGKVAIKYFFLYFAERYSKEGNILKNAKNRRDVPGATALNTYYITLTNFKSFENKYIF